MHFKTLNYTNGRFEIDGYKFSNDFIKKYYPEYAFDDNVKIVYYKEATGKNCIIYKDGTKEPLSDFEEHYNNLLLDSYGIYIKYKNEQEVHGRLINEEHNKAVALLSPLKLFDTGLTEEEQDNLIEKAKKLKPHIIIDDDYFYNALSSIKTKLLKESDYTQLTDVQLTLTEEQKDQWIKYRSDLRLLDKTSNPKSVRLPKLPDDID